MSNLGQHDGDGIRYAMHLSAPKGGTAQMLRDPAGGWVSWEDYARLKAEVERLTSDLQMEKENEDRLVREWQRANNEVYGLKTQVAALIDDQIRLKAEVERLTKAGDAMASIIKYEPGVNGFDPVPNVVKRWNAAKEGKQS